MAPLSAAQQIVERAIAALDAENKQLTYILRDPAEDRNLAEVRRAVKDKCVKNDRINVLREALDKNKKMKNDYADEVFDDLRRPDSEDDFAQPALPSRHSKAALTETNGFAPLPAGYSGSAAGSVTHPNENVHSNAPPPAYPGSNAGSVAPSVHPLQNGPPVGYAGSNAGSVAPSVHPLQNGPPAGYAGSIAGLVAHSVHPLQSGPPAGYAGSVAGSVAPLIQHDQNMQLQQHAQPVVPVNFTNNMVPLNMDPSQINAYIAAQFGFHGGQPAGVPQLPSTGALPAGLFQVPPQQHSATRPGAELVNNRAPRRQRTDESGNSNARPTVMTYTPESFAADRHNLDKKIAYCIGKHRQPINEHEAKVSVLPEPQLAYHIQMKNQWGQLLTAFTKINDPTQADLLRNVQEAYDKLRDVEDQKRHLQPPPLALQVKALDQRMSAFTQAHKKVLERLDEKSTTTNASNMTDDNTNSVTTDSASTTVQQKESVPTTADFFAKYNAPNKGCRFMWMAGKSGHFGIKVGDDEASHREFWNDFKTTVEWESKQPNPNLPLLKYRVQKDKPVKLFFDIDWKWSAERPQFNEWKKVLLDVVKRQYWNHPVRRRWKLLELPDNWGVHIESRGSAKWHIIFPEIIDYPANLGNVAKELSSALAVTFPQYNWDNVLDLSVYENNGLRTTFSGKPNRKPKGGKGEKKPKESEVDHDPPPPGTSPFYTVVDVDDRNEITKRDLSIDDLVCDCIIPTSEDLAEYPIQFNTTAPTQKKRKPKATTPATTATEDTTQLAEGLEWLNDHFGWKDNAWNVCKIAEGWKLLGSSLNCTVQNDHEHLDKNHSCILVSENAVTLNCLHHRQKKAEKDMTERLIAHFYPKQPAPALPVDENDPHKQKLVEDSLDGSTLNVAKLACHLTRGMVICQRRTDWYQFGPHTWQPKAGGPGILVATLLEREFAAAKEHYENLPLTTEVARILKQIDKILVHKVRESNWRKGLIAEMGELLEEECQKIKFNTKPFLLCFQNGVYELRTGVFRDGRPEDYINKCLTYALPREVNAKKRAFIAARVEEIMPYPEEREYLNMALATALEGINEHELLFVLSGIGRNGKGLIKDLTLEALDQDVYCKAPAAKLLTGGRPNSNQASPDLVDLHGATGVFLSEPNPNQAIKTSTIKPLIGNDSTRLRQNYGTQGTVKPTYSTFLLCNTIPKLDNDEENLWQKFAILTFPARFLVNPDPNDPLQHPVDSTLKRQIPELARHWMLYLLDQYKIYAGRNYTLPPQTQRMKQCLVQYQKTTNFLREFAEDCLEFGDPQTDIVLVKTVYEEFESWWEEQSRGVNPFKGWETFSKQLGQIDSSRFHHGRKRPPGAHRTAPAAACFFGLKLKTTHDEVKGKSQSAEHPVDDPVR